MPEIEAIVQAAPIRVEISGAQGPAASVASTTHAATSKATPVDADEIPLADSAALWVLKKLTWANLKATLKTYFDSLYSAVGHSHAWDSLTGTASKVPFNTAAAMPATKGEIAWDSDEETLAIALANGSILQVGQETLFHVENNTGVTIANGTPVKYAGTVGNSGKLRVTPWDGTEPKLFMGLATSAITHEGTGYVAHFGKVRGIQTNGANYSETWVNGDLIYAKSGSAGLTKTEPTAAGYYNYVGIVISAHATNGTLAIHPHMWKNLVAADISGTAVVDNDARLTNARTPTAHKSSHATGGSDALSPSDIGAPAITAITQAGNLKGINLAASGELGGTVTGSFVLINIGDPDGVDGAALEALPVGLFKYAGISLNTRNLYFNYATKTWKIQNTSYPACAVEVGQEGITIHTAATGVSDLNAQHHAMFQVRPAGVTGNPTSGTYYTGPTIHPKAPINFVYTNSTYATLGDQHPWQPTGQAVQNKDVPHIWFSDAFGDHECAVRADNSGASNSGGQIFQFRKSRGTSAANSGDYAGFFDFYYKGTSAYILTNRIYSRAEAAPTTSAVASMYMGTSGAELRVHSSGAIGMKALTVGTLPSASTLGAGARSFVTDSNAALAAGLGNIVAAGGTDSVPVYSDGTNWRIG